MRFTHYEICKLIMSNIKMLLRFILFTECLQLVQGIRFLLCVYVFAGVSWLSLPLIGSLISPCLKASFGQTSLRRSLEMSKFSTQFWSCAALNIGGNRSCMTDIPSFSVGSSRFFVILIGFDRQTDANFEHWRTPVHYGHSGRVCLVFNAKRYTWPMRTPVHHGQITKVYRLSVVDRFYCMSVSNTWRVMEIYLWIMLYCRSNPE